MSKGSEVIRFVLALHRVAIPSPLWHQIGADWSPSARKGIADFAKNLPRDLEHLYRNCRKASRQRKHPLPSECLSVLLRIVRLAAFTFNHFCHSLKLKTLWKRCAGGWGAAAFADQYFFPEYTCSKKLRDGTELVVADFYSGWKSPLREGQAVTQNYVEGFFSSMKQTAEVANSNNSVVAAMSAFEVLGKQWITTPGLEHSLMGDAQEQRCCPPSYAEASEDLVSGPSNCRIFGGLCHQIAEI